MHEVPASHADLLERPVFAHLATVRPDGGPQSSVMWFAWDGSRIRLTRTGMDYPIQDADVRVVITIRPDRFVAVRSGAVIGREI